MSKHIPGKLTLIASTLLVALSSAGVMAKDVQFSHFFGECSAKWGSNTDINKAMGNGECAIITTLANKYNVENSKGYTVNYKSLPEGTYYDALRASYATGDNPDVSIMHSSVMPGYIKRSLLVDLTDSFKQNKVDTKDFFPKIRESVSYDNKYYGLPFDSHSLLWHTNVELFKKAGLVDGKGEPIMPSSPEEALAQAKLIKEKTGAEYITASMNDPKMSNPLWFWQSLVGQQGARYTDVTNTKARINTKEGREALAFMNRLVDGGYMSPYSEYGSSEQSFLNGKSAILANGTWVVDSYNTQAKGGKIALKEYRAMAFPTLYQQPGVWQDNHTWVVTRNPNRTEAQMEAVGDFLAYLNENNVYWASTGHLPARQSAQTTELFKSMPQRQYYAANAENANSVPPILNGRAFLEVVREELKASWLTDKTVEQAVEKAERRANQVMNR